MAQYRNAAQFYQKNSVQTASPAKIILMLYDGAIKFCHMAQVAIDEKNIEKANPDVLSFSDVTGCDIDVEEDRLKFYFRDGHSVTEHWPIPRRKKCQK